MIAAVRMMLGEAFRTAALVAAVNARLSDARSGAIRSRPFRCRAGRPPHTTRPGRTTSRRQGLTAAVHPPPRRRARGPLDPTGSRVQGVSCPAGPGLLSKSPQACVTQQTCGSDLAARAYSGGLRTVQRRQRRECHLGLAAAIRPTRTQVWTGATAPGSLVRGAGQGRSISSEDHSLRPPAGSGGSGQLSGRSDATSVCCLRAARALGCRARCCTPRKGTRGRASSKPGRVHNRTMS